MPSQVNVHLIAHEYLTTGLANQQNLRFGTGRAEQLAESNARLVIYRPRRCDLKKPESR